MMIAVKLGISLGYKSFVIDGGMGGKLDHTIANLQVLVYLAHNGAHGYLLGQDVSATAVTNGTVSFSETETGLISIFCAGDRAIGVKLTGLKYPLDNATLTCDFPLGVSNEFIGEPATISVRDGTLLVMWTGNIDGIKR